MDKVVMVALVSFAFACETSAPDSCKVTCVADADCPDGQQCGELGLCTAGEACPCEADEFRGCDGNVARFCNATADGLELQACPAGCNADAGRCNSCVPDTDACITEGSMLERCGADGLQLSASACELTCVPEAASVPAHCGYLEPLFFPDLCDELATSPEVTFAEVTLDTSADATCNGGILTQTGGPAVCVIRALRITIGNNVVVRGGRVVAFVADEAVLVQGTLDASADGNASGPGGGAQSGDRAATKRGGGGAGFGTAGGAGGTGAGGGGAAGAAFDPLPTVLFVGGRSPAGPTLQQGPTYPIPGGGGGGVMLVACRGDVAVSGTIDVGGGGGKGGRDSDVTTNVNNVGGTGGGSGGYVVLQGINVNVSGSGGVFANGGSGGGGCVGDGCVAGDGNDATRSTSGVGGGAGGGGDGGGATADAEFGSSTTDAPAGGGGAVGRLQVCHPDVGVATIAATVSPPSKPTVTIPTR